MVVQLFNSAVQQCHQGLKFLPAFLSLSVYRFTFGLTSYVAKKMVATVPTSHPDMSMSKAEEMSMSKAEEASCVYFLLKSNSNRSQVQKLHGRELLISERPDVSPIATALNQSGWEGGQERPGTRLD